MKRWCVMVALSAGLAHAEAGWLTSHGRVADTTRLEVFGGTRSFGLGAVISDAGNRRAATSIEAVYAYFDRAAELRGGRVWQLTGNGTATLSASLSGSLHVVPYDAFDFGLGPHGALTLALGGDVFSFDVGLQTGAELFIRGPIGRFPERILIGVSVRLGNFSLSLQGRAGVDVIVGHGFIGRAEAVLSLGWFGLERATAVVQ